MSEKNLENKEIKPNFTLDAIVEIPKGSRNKYEFDYEKKMMRYDRMIFSSMHYPTDYGFFPETLARDGDALDALVLVTEPTFPGCIIEVRPIGLFKMHDDKGPDDKILCVPVSDPIWNHIYDLSEVSPHLKLEIEHFFQVYKDLEKKKVDVQGWEDSTAAYQAIKDAQQLYMESKWKSKK